MMKRREFIWKSALAAYGAGLMAPCSAGERAGHRFLPGCYTRPWDQFEYRVALDGIAEAGFEYAGIMTAKGKSWVIVNVDSAEEEIAALSQEVKKRGLKTLSIYAGDFPATKGIDEGAKGLRRLIDHCRMCECPDLLLGGTSQAESFRAYYTIVKECCDYAATKNVRLSIKPHGGQNATGPQCRKIIEMVGKRNFGLWYDPGNIFYYSDGALDPVDDSVTVDGLVCGMSIKDFVPPKEVLVTPGTGKVNFGKVMANLKRGGFNSGPLLVECLARKATAREITAEAKRARAFLRELIG